MPLIGINHPAVITKSADSVVRVALITIGNDFTFLRGVFLDVIYLDQKQFFNNNISKSQG